MKKLIFFIISLTLLSCEKYELETTPKLTGGKWILVDYDVTVISSISEVKVIKGGQKTLSQSKVIMVEVSLYDLYEESSTIGAIENLLPNHFLYSIPFISYNSMNLRTDWVELFFVSNSYK